MSNEGASRKAFLIDKSIQIALFVIDVGNCDSLEITLLSLVVGTVRKLLPGIS